MEAILNKMFKVKNREEKMIAKLRNNAKNYALKMQKVFGCFHLDGFICKINERGYLVAPMSSDHETVGKFDNILISTKEELQEFKKDLDKTFGIKLKYTQEEFFELFREYGEHSMIKERNADVYELAYDEYNVFGAIKEPDGEIWFRRDSGSSRANASYPFDFEGDMTEYIICVLNIISKNNEKKLPQ